MKPTPSPLFVCNQPAEAGTWCILSCPCDCDPLMLQLCSRNQGMAYIQADISDMAQVDHMVRTATARFPSLDCVVNAAGIQRQLNFSSGDVDLELLVGSTSNSCTGS